MNRGHDVGPDDQHPAVGAALDELRSHGQGIDEAGARGGEVEAPGPGGPESRLNQAGGGGKRHVRGDRGHDDEIDVVGAEAPTFEALPGGRGREFGGPDAFLGVVAGGDSGPRADPFVVRGHELFEVLVVEDPRAAGNVRSR